MPNTSNTWKTGEKAVEPGEYECLNCKARGLETRITLEVGEIFPYCSGCDVKDNTYRKLPRTK